MADSTDIMVLTAQIVSAHVSHNSVAAENLQKLIRDVHEALGNVTKPPSARKEPAVGVKQSVRPDAIICLECGKKFSMLKRHLMTDHKLSPAEYRREWELPASYPLVAPNYAKVRSNLAKQIGLGRKSSRTHLPTAKRRGRPPKKA